MPTLSIIAFRVFFMLPYKPRGGHRDPFIISPEMISKCRLIVNR